MNTRFPRLFREKFTAQVFLAFTLFICALSLAFILVFLHYQNKSLVAGLEKSGRLMTEILAYESRIGIFSENKTLLEKPVDGILRNPTVLGVSAYNLNGALIFRKMQQDLPKQILSDYTHMPAVSDLYISQATAKDIRFAHLQQVMAVWAPVMSGTGIELDTTLAMEAASPTNTNYPLGYVRIVLDKGHLNTQLTVLLRNTVLMGGVFLLVGALFTLLLASQISRPLKLLTTGVKRYGEEGVCENLPIEKKNEIGNLARSFQKMVDALAKREAEKKKIEQQLWQSQKLEAIGTLAGGIAHDFNNILGIISGYTELALMELPADSRVQNSLSEVFKASGRARDLVHQILTFSRQGEKERRPLQIGSIVKEVLKMLRATMPASVDIKSHIEKNIPAVIADPVQIHQVLMNLCTNAGHAMREQGGLLEVSLTQQEIDLQTAKILSVSNPGRYQKLTIRDTGHGMSQDVIDRIFDPFYTTKGHGQGTGLGLSVVHGVVKNHQGAIKVTSDPGKGTEFEIYFPSKESAKDIAKPALLPLPTGPERILLIDDELTLLSMASDMLESLGYTVSSRSSSVEALAAFRDHPDAFDLVITDMTMPKMTGAELARQILKLRPNMPIILCTGFSETIQEEAAKSIGIREFVMKPILRRTIAQIIRRVMDEPLDR